MPVDNLLRPDNRLLGFGTGDFSYFGGQPDPAVVSSHVSTVAVPAPADAAPSSASPIDAPERVLDSGQAVPAADDPAPVSAGGGASSPTAPPTGPGELAAASEEDAVQPVSGGSTSPAILNQSLTAAPDGSTPNNVSDSASPAGDIASGQEFQTVAPALTALTGAAATAQSAQVEALLSGTTDLLSDLAGGADAAVDTLGATNGVVAGLTGTVDTAAAAPVHDIDSLIFGGTDPAGGISTLVGLVETSELFTVGQAEAPVPADASGSIVDDLIGDAAVNTPILGEHDSTHDLTGDDGIHLGI